MPTAYMRAWPSALLLQNDCSLGFRHIGAVPLANWQPVGAGLEFYMVLLCP